MTAAPVVTTFRVKPLHLQLGMVVTIGVWFGLSLAIISGDSLPPRSAGVFVNLASMVAYAAALVFCWSIQGEYRHTFWFRVAWLALGVRAALSVSRHALDTGLPALWWNALADAPTAGFVRHLIVLPATLALLLGLLTTWLCVRRAGLGFKVHARDLGAIGALIAVLLGTWYYREQLSQAASPFTWARYLQHATILSLCFCSAISILLHRLSVQMGGGKLAIAMKYLIFYCAVRFLLVFPGLFSPLHAVPTQSDLVAGILFYSTPWVFALATSHRRELSAGAIPQGSMLTTAVGI